MIKHIQSDPAVCVCVRVCVLDRERQGERRKEREIGIYRNILLCQLPESI